MIAIILLALAAGCGRKEKTPDATARIEASGAVPQAVKSLVKAVAEDDSAAFAGLVSYPLQRPYPLKDIVDAREMTAYYHTMVDDSLRRMLTGSGPEDWDEYGWRGWSVKNGEYVWVDSLVYDMPYTSAAERKELREMSRREIESLAPALRGDWQPVAAFSISDGRTARIDSRPGVDPAADGAFRLAIYPKGADLRKTPEIVMDGSLDPEGSALNPVYSFSDRKGHSAVIVEDPADSESPLLTIGNADGYSEDLDARRVYWLDLLK